MIGSEKQIAWAQEIKKIFIEKHEKLQLDGWKDVNSGHVEDKERFTKELQDEQSIFDELMNVKSAKFWIDSRREVSYFVTAYEILLRHSKLDTYQGE